MNLRAVVQFSGNIILIDFAVTSIFNECSINGIFEKCYDSMKTIFFECHYIILHKYRYTRESPACSHYQNYTTHRQKKSITSP